MKKIILAFATTLITLTSVVAQQKLAHLDTKKVLDTMPSRKTASQELETMQKNNEQELRDSYAEVQKLEAVYNEKKPTYPPLIEKSERERIERKYQELQEREQTLNYLLQQYSEQLNKPILEKVKKAIEIVSDRKKLAYVFDISSVELYNKGGIDITSEVIVEVLKLENPSTTPAPTTPKK